MRSIPFCLTLLLLLTSCHLSGKFQPWESELPETPQMLEIVDSANACFDRSDYINSLKLAKQVTEMAIAVKDSGTWWEGLSCMMATYCQLGMNDSAIIVSRKLLEYDKKMGDPFTLSSDYNNLAYLYQAAGYDNIEAEEFILKAIDYEKQVEGSPGLGIRYGNAAEIYRDRGDTKRALEYIRMAYEFDSIAENTVRMGRRLSKMGDILVDMRNSREAESCYHRALALLEPSSDRHSLGTTYRQLGYLYLKEGRKDEGIEWLKKAAVLGEEIHELKALVSVYQQLGEAYHGVDTEQENNYLKLYTEAKDSLTAEQKQREMTEFKVRYDTDSQTALANEKSRLLSSTRFWAGIGIALLLALTAVLLIMWRRKIHHNRLLRSQLEALRQQMSDQREQYLMQQQMKESNSGRAAVDQEFIESVNKAIFDLMGRSEVSADKVASNLCITPQQLRRRIQAILGVTSLAYINSVRIDYAKDLLKNQPQLNITEIGQLCGFDEPAHFSRTFHKETGISPSEFRFQE